MIEKAIAGDTDALLVVQEQYRNYIERVSRNIDMKERLNEKLLMAVLKFRMTIGRRISSKDGNSRQG